MGLLVYEGKVTLKKLLWSFRAIFIGLLVMLALGFHEIEEQQIGLFLAMFVLSSTIAIPYKYDWRSKFNGNSLFDRIGFAIGSVILLWIVSFISIKIATMIGRPEYWIANVIFWGTFGLLANERELTKKYRETEFSQQQILLVQEDIQLREKAIKFAPAAYFFGSAIIAALFLAYDIPLSFNNWTSWSGMLLGAVFSGLLGFSKVN